MATIESSPFETIILTNDSVDPKEWPRLTCGAANQLALGVAELPVDSRLGLHFQGPGQISSSSNDLLITGELTVPNNLTVGGAIAATTLSVTNNVGIETTNPEHNLQIGNAANPVSLSLRGPDLNPQANTIAFEDDGQTEERWFRLIHDTQNNALKITSKEVDPIATFSRRTGNVGIGTANPAFPLSLGSSLGTTKLALYETGADNSYGLGVVAGQFRLHLNGNRARFAFFDSDRADANEIVTIGGSGNVHVKGGLFVDNVPFRDRGNAQYDTSTKQFCYDNSSLQTKENITPLKDDFYKILQVEPRTYTRPGDSERWEIGYIAEEFHDLGLNKLIYYDEDGSPEAINYPKICIYLVEVMKNLVQRINDLDKKTKDYEQRIQQLKQHTG